MTIPGIGPIIASAMVAAVGSGTAFAKGRDFAAWLGLVPKQMSTGDRTILGRISKRRASALTIAGSVTAMRKVYSLPMLKCRYPGRSAAGHGRAATTALTS